MERNDLDKNFHIDRDIINLTCKDSIDFLPMKYNVPAYLSLNDLKKYHEESLYSEFDLLQAINFSIIIYYSGEKPWNNPFINKVRIWYNYVKSNKILSVLFIDLIKETEQNKIIMFIKKIFSISNTDKSHKQICICGVKIKLKVKR